MRRERERGDKGEEGDMELSKLKKVVWGEGGKTLNPRN